MATFAAAGTAGSVKLKNVHFMSNRATGRQSGAGPDAGPQRVGDHFAVRGLQRQATGVAGRA